LRDIFVGASKYAMQSDGMNFKDSETLGRETCDKQIRTLEG